MVCIQTVAMRRARLRLWFRAYEQLEIRLSYRRVPRTQNERNATQPTQSRKKFYAVVFFVCVGWICHTVCVEIVSDHDAICVFSVVHWIVYVVGTLELCWCYVEKPDIQYWINNNGNYALFHFPMNPYHLEQTIRHCSVRHDYSHCKSHSHKTDGAAKRTRG